MLQKNLPVCGDWSTEEEFRPKKMIAALIHKYIRDAMLKETTATQTIVDEFKLAKTTIHRQIWGKKYPGGGQKVDRRGPEASVSGMKRLAAVILKRSEAMEALIEKTEEVSKKKVEKEKATSASKGKGGGKSSTTKRSAKEIRGDSTAEGEKVKRKRKKEDDAAEEAELNEDPDMPTAKERAAALVSLSTKRPTKGVMIVH